jgi:16S rRNA G527 N7-methylase RsmG
MADKKVHLRGELKFINPNNEKIKKIKEYIDCVLSYNKHTNIISRLINHRKFRQLINESILLHPLISTSLVVDAGSGNGLLGIPLAIIAPLRQVVLVETRQKKINFLLQAKKDLNLEAVEIRHEDIQQYLSQLNNKRDITLVARGFPRADILLHMLYKYKLSELLLVTSARKIKKNQKELEKFRQTLYNIPLRDEIMVVKLENVSRET